MGILPFSMSQGYISLFSYILNRSADLYLSVSFIRWMKVRERERQREDRRQTEQEWIYIDSLLLQFDAPWVSLCMTTISVFNDVNGVPSLSNLAHTHQLQTNDESVNPCLFHSLSIFHSFRFHFHGSLIAHTPNFVHKLLCSKAIWSMPCSSLQVKHLYILSIDYCYSDYRPYTLGISMEIFDYYNRMEEHCYLPRRCCIYFNWTYLTFSLSHWLLLCLC